MNTKNVIWNMAGLSVPLIFAVMAIPVLLRGVGEEKFGIFMLAWGVVGFSSLLDLGIGRATTHELSKRRGGATTGTASEIFVTAERLAWTSGLIGAFGIALLVQLGAYRLLNFSPALDSDMIWSGWIVAMTMPLHVVSAMYRGVNEAYGQYRGISIIRMALGVANFLFPAAVSLFTNNLTAIISTLLVSRLLAMIAFRILATKEIGKDDIGKSSSPRFKKESATKLLKFGLWNSVSSFLGPLMQQSDRFIIGSVLTVSAVAAYTVPYEVATKILIIPGAVTTVMFPSITAGMVAGRKLALQSFWRWFVLTSIIMSLAAAAFYVAAPLLLHIWLGEALPDGSAEVARIIAIGLIPYTMGSMMFSLVHADHRPDITAKSHMFQFPIYIALSYWAIQNYGVIGAAAAWTIRISADAAILIIWQVLFNSKKTPIVRSSP